jgi:hypothetical protein
MTGTPDELQEQLLDFFAARLAGQPPRPQVRPIVCVDECLNHPVLAEQLEDLHRRRVVQYVTGAWHEIRANADGTESNDSYFPLMPLQVARLLTPASQDSWRQSARIPGRRYPDVQVMWQVVAQFQCGDAVFFLSANRKRDDQGIKRLLDDRVRPLVARYHGGRYSLTALWKRARTDVPAFGERISRIIGESPPAPGYHARSF